MSLNDTVLGTVTLRNLLCAVFFIIPAIAALLMISANASFVLRDRVDDLLSPYLIIEAAKSDETLDSSASCDVSPERCAASQAAISPAVIAQIYHYAIAASTTFIFAIVLISQCLVWQYELSRFTSEGVNRRYYIILPLVALFPIFVACIDKHFIDDKAVIGLFVLSKLSEIYPPILFGYDSRILGAAIFTAFLFAAATTALAAAGSPEANPSKAEVDRRMAIVRSTLLATSVVLVGALVASKLRLDTGALMFGAANGPAAIAFQTVANAVMNYWAAVLSIGLAFIYGPPALLLYGRLAAMTGSDTGARAESKWLTSENVMRVVRLLAVLAPPIVAAGLEVLPK